MRIPDKYRSPYLFLHDLNTKDQVWEALRRDKSYRKAWAEKRTAKSAQLYFQETWGLKEPCDPYGETKPLFFDSLYEEKLSRISVFQTRPLFNMKEIKKILSQKSPPLTKKEIQTTCEKLRQFMPIDFDTENLIEALAVYDLRNGENSSPELVGKKLSINACAQLLYPDKKPDSHGQLKPGAENVKATKKFLKRLCTRTNLLSSTYYAKYRDNNLSLAKEFALLI